MKFRLTTETRAALRQLTSTIYGFKYSANSAFISFDEEISTVIRTVRQKPSSQFSAAEFTNRFLDGDKEKFRVLLRCVADPAICIDIQNFDLSKRAFVISPSTYYNLTMLPELLTVDKYKDKAPIVAGEVAKFGEIPIVVSYPDSDEVYHHVRDNV